MEIYELTLAQAAEKLRNKEISAKELTQSVFTRIEQVEGEVHAYNTTY